MRKLILFTLLASTAALLSVGAAVAQSMPGEQAREIMIKATLMTFNDANLTNNYTVFDALASQPFAEQFPPEKLSEAFKPFRDQNIDIAVILTYSPVEDPAPVIVSDGSLQLKGYFETEPSYVAYDLSFIGDDEGAWRVVSINVHVAPPEDLGIETSE
jgi:mRNA-degrading endonuclease YafQ of YafQ-DinJ toxin-antitoxin module